MIEFVRGNLSQVGSNYAVIETGGIGYRLFVSDKTIAGLPPLGQELSFFTYLQVREDDLSLYGFLTREEREAFLSLLTVSGVGPKLALAVVSYLGPEELQQAIFYQETRILMTIPGVGKKTAERIILELKDKIGKMEIEARGAQKQAVSGAQVRKDAVDALVALGYSPQEAEKVLPLPGNIEEKATVEDLVRMALNKML